MILPWTLFLATVALVAANDWPVIGVFTQPSTSSDPACGGNCLYLAASYVKHIESAGARVVPINYYSSEEELDKILSSVNGVWFPGGGAVYPDSAQYTFDQIIKFNDNGDFMPLWGTCMGFQWLLIAASRDVNILDPKDGVMDSYNYSIPLDFTSSARSSKLFMNAPAFVYDVLAKENVTMNNHHYGIFTDHFQSTESLTSFYNMLSTNDDRQGVNFVSTIEAFKYPIFGTQWHPEKNIFEWEKVNGAPYEAINHSPEAIKIAQYTANFLVEQARNNQHKFSSDSEEDSFLIWNYQPSRTGPSFVQTYFFPNDF